MSKKDKHFLNEMSEKVFSDVVGKLKRGNYSPIFMSMDNPISLRLYDKTINEGLIRIYPPDTLVKYVCKSLDLDENDVLIKLYNNNIRIAYEVKNEDFFIEQLKRAMSIGGYHFAFKVNKDNNTAIVVFEGSHLRGIGDEIRKNYRYLYHITPSCFLEKIKSIGLKPTARNVRFSYPSRTHFLLYHPSECMDFVKDLVSSKDNNTWYCLTIDLEKVKDYVEFHYGTSCEIGIYTDDNIGPEAIVNIEELKGLE